MASIVGMTLAPPRLSVRGVIPIRITVASGAFRCITSSTAVIPLATFSTTRCIDAVPRHPADVVRAGHQHDDLRMHIVELTVGEPPENVLDGVPSPSEVRGIPSEEAARPVVEEVAIRRIARSPSPGDRVAREVDVDAAAPRFLEELGVRDARVLVDARNRLAAVRRRRPPSAGSRRQLPER